MANIKTYARIKPGQKLFPHYETTEDTVTINAINGHSDWPASTTLKHSQSDVYKFSHVFPNNSSQEQVFDTASKDIVTAFLNGYNGTIFAYGQTGSGKTYTMEGSGRLYKDRGLAPRALSMIYNMLAEQKDTANTIHISYLEIYQEIGYDLLNPAARNSSTVTPFPKVAVLDCMGGSCLVKNLTSHVAASEAVAQSLLLQGQANRKVAETPMNQRSSRSHAILTLQLTSQKTGSDVITRSKLHLVDLAGSERVAKTRTEGVQLTEAKYINLSLHHLESVIVALQRETGSRSGGKSLGAWTKSKHYKSYSPYNIQWSKQNTSTFSMTRRPSEGSDIYQTSKHIPYRNSLLTMVLKDSLGGNCMTAMIATLSMESSNLNETLSTCRFAQRVACIMNTVRRNEEIDDKSLIRQLQRRIGQLEAELTLIKLGQASGSNSDDTITNSKLTDEDKIFCEDLMKDFIAGKVKNPLLQGISTPQLFFQCLKNLKDLIVSHVCQSNARNVYSETVANKPKRPPVFHPSASADDLKKIITQEEKQEKMTLAKRPTSSGGRYKSPYEKKQEREIQRLNEKIERALNHQEEEERKMKDWKENIKRQQLEILFKEISHKADATREQIASQHAYILTLKHDGADHDVIRQEKMAEKQLKKREAKIERRLEHIKVKIDQAESPEERERPSSGQVRTKSVEEKYSKLKKADGTLNTRQVLQKLQLEERKQHKKESKLQQQRINTVAEELELREAATRQKLLEFKEKLRMFRESSNSRSMFDSSEKMLNSSGYGSLPFSLINGLNATDSDKSEMMIPAAGRMDGWKFDPELYQNGIVSAFKPYKGCAEVNPTSGWLDKASGLKQNVEVEKQEIEFSDPSMKMKAEGQVVQKYAFTSPQASGELNRGDQVQQTTPPGVENEKYPFIKAALRDQEISGKLAQSKSTLISTKPPLPTRQESRLNGWMENGSRSSQSAHDKWNSVYSTVSSRPNTADTSRYTSTPQRKSEKGGPISGKWNIGTNSRPSSGNSVGIFSDDGYPVEKWDTSYRINSPQNTWSGVGPSDVLQTKSSSPKPKNFAQSYETDGFLGNIPLAMKSNTSDTSASDPNKSDTSTSKRSTKIKTDTKPSSAERRHDKRSQHRKKMNLKSSSFSDFRDSSPQPVSRSLSFPEPTVDNLGKTYRYSPSEINTMHDADMRKMKLKKKDFDSALQNMLNGSGEMNGPALKTTKGKPELFDILLKPNPLDDDPPSQRIVAYKEEEREPKYMEKARQEKERVARIRRVRSAAETIQRFWRRYHDKK